MGHVCDPRRVRNWPPDDNHPPGGRTYLRMYTHRTSTISYNTSGCNDTRLTQRSTSTAPCGQDRGIIRITRTSSGSTGHDRHGTCSPEQLKGGDVATARKNNPDSRSGTRISPSRRKAGRRYTRSSDICGGRTSPAEDEGVLGPAASEAFPIPFSALRKTIIPRVPRPVRRLRTPAGARHKQLIPAVPFIHSGTSWRTVSDQHRLDFTVDQIPPAPVEHSLFSEYGYNWSVLRSSPLRQRVLSSGPLQAAHCHPSPATFATAHDNPRCLRLLESLGDGIRTVSSGTRIPCRVLFRLNLETTKSRHRPAARRSTWKCRTVARGDARSGECLVFEY